MMHLNNNEYDYDYDGKLVRGAKFDPRRQGRYFMYRSRNIK